MQLPDLITKILLERQSFTNISEDSIINEIQQKHTAENESEEIVSTTNEPIKLDENTVIGKNGNTVQDFQIQKNELTKNLSLALNETSLCLDFVSLLISRVRPNLVKATISPYLSKLIPLGSINTDRLTSDPQERNEANASRIGLGWKSDHLSKITNTLKTTSTRLHEQIIKEKKYWDDINAVVSSKEVLYKTRDPLNGARTLGVKYGFGDSGSNYYDKGLAVLRKEDSTGEAMFAQHVSSELVIDKTYKYVRVRILSKSEDDFMLTGQSRFESKHLNSNHHMLINAIEKARYFIFEEDLFFHLLREAKLLIHYGVQVISDKIIVENYNEIIEIETINYDEENEDELNNRYQNVNEYSCINNDRAQAILTFMKILLCNFYKYNLGQKQRICTHSRRDQTKTDPLILRPLLGYLKHKAYLRQMNFIIKNCQSQFENKATFKIENIKCKHLETKNTSDSPFAVLINHPLSIFTIIVKPFSKSDAIKINFFLTATDLYCSLVISMKMSSFENEADAENDKNGIRALLITYYDFNEAKESLEWTIANFLRE